MDLESDISCLKSIKDSMEDPLNYLSSSWNFNNATEGFICHFTGVECWHPDENKVINIQLSNMGLRGQFPRGIANCTALIGLDLSSNFLSGPIPSDISKLLHYVMTLDLSSNNFSGEIPRDIANCSYLNVLKLDSNQLTGQIPAQVGLLDRINTFSASNNLLSGPAPNFVNNANISVESLANNKGLCGGPLAPCKAAKNNNHAFFISGFVVGYSVSTVFVFALTLFYLPIIPLRKIMSSRKKKKINQVVVQASQLPTTKNRSEHSKIMSSRKKKKIYQVVVQASQLPTTKNRSEHGKICKLEKLVTRTSFSELMNATNNFSADNIIGLGKMRTMYKAVLPNGFFLAIKRFYDSECCEGHFVSEIMTLGRLRHTNLVPLLSFCYETEDRLLVYKFMSNGNLYDWLHPPTGEPKIMEWPLRVKIGVGLARGLAWLHHNCRFRVFHHNISSKCILLDQNFEPKISNFGEAKFMNTNENSSVGCSSLNGEFLEFGFDKKDVFSFGIVLLELVTRKELSETSNSSVSSDGALVEWIINLSSSSFSLYDAVDDSLIGLGFDDEINQFLTIASNCVKTFPDERPTMLEVYQTMRAVGEKHGLVDDSEMWKQTEISATAGEGDE